MRVNFIIITLLSLLLFLPEEGKTDTCGCYPGDGRCETDTCSVKDVPCTVRHCEPYTECGGTYGVCYEKEGWCWSPPDDGGIYCVRPIEPPQPVCGNGSCESGEDVQTCCKDCGTPCSNTCDTCDGKSCFCPNCVANVSSIE
ncbi:MAG: hypothetical protein NC826_04395 [Candidatus Omnitrophica bacterium]|nr:hypothetical protein [Candidatus Omnitrophota bacterium]